MTAPKPNPQGRLGELAGYSEPQDRWMEQALSRLNTLYMADPDGIIVRTKDAAMRAHGGRRDMQQPLAELRRDYASFWLAKRLLGDGLPDMAVQGAHWQGTLAAVPDRQLALTLAVAGFDPITPRLYDGSPVLHAFAFGATQPELEEFLQHVPQAHRAALINQPGEDGMTVMHVAAMGAGPGCLDLLSEHGGDPAVLMNITLPTGEVVKGNCAHVATFSGRPDMVAELMACDRGLFARARADIKYRPDQLVELCRQHKGGANLELRKAANLAAHAIDLPIPYPEAGWVIGRLLPSTAPRPCLPGNDCN